MTLLNLQSLLGTFALIALAWSASESRRTVAWKDAAIALIATFGVAIIMLKLPGAARLLAAASVGVDAVAEATRAGTSFVFDYLGGGQLPYELQSPGAEFVLALQALPIVLVMSVLTTLLFYWRVLPPVVRGFSLLLERTLNIGGAVGLSTAANIFLGMVEAPLLIRPYLASLSRSELFMVMTGGMAGIAGTVLVLYATMLRAVVPDAAAHFIVASVLAAPAAILISRIMVPESGEKHAGHLAINIGPVASSNMDAIVRGTTMGLELLLNICAMLIVLVALVHLANAAVGVLPPVAGDRLTPERLLGTGMAPVCWLMGIPWAQATTAGSLMGVKTVLNEFIAYVQLAKLPADALDARSRLIMLYALCGFANFGSVGIMIAGLGTMVPERRNDVTSLGPKSIVSGTLATCLTGTLVGLMTPADG
jgi:CNT family concentrative nucleoside transporter